LTSIRATHATAPTLPCPGSRPTNSCFNPNAEAPPNAPWLDSGVSSTPDPESPVTSLASSFCFPRKLFNLLRPHDPVKALGGYLLSAALSLVVARLSTPVDRGMPGSEEMDWSDGPRNSGTAWKSGKGTQGSFRGEDCRDGRALIDDADLVGDVGVEGVDEPEGRRLISLITRQGERQVSSQPDGSKSCQHA
jgi:hypothetical protein